MSIYLILYILHSYQRAKRQKLAMRPHYLDFRRSGKDFTSPQKKGKVNVSD